MIEDLAGDIASVNSAALAEIRRKGGQGLCELRTMRPLAAKLAALEETEIQVLCAVPVVLVKPCLRAGWAQSANEDKTLEPWVISYVHLLWASRTLDRTAVAIMFGVDRGLLERIYRTPLVEQWTIAQAIAPCMRLRFEIETWRQVVPLIDVPERNGRWQIAPRLAAAGALQARRP